MAFGKSFSMAKSNIKEKSMEYLRNVTNRSIAEPQDTRRGRPTTPSPPPDPTSVPNTPSTSTPTPKKPNPKILSTPPSTRRSKPSPKSRRNASSSSIVDKSAAKQKQKQKEKEKQESPIIIDQSSAKQNQKEKEKQEIPHTDPLPFNKLELEGLRNNLVSQLQKLADRAEWINEWMEMDAIKLARLVEVTGRNDVERDAGRDTHAHQQRTESSTADDPSAPGPSRPPRRAYNSSTDAPVSLTMHEGRLVDTRYFMSRQERIHQNCSIRELQIRIKGMRRWSRDLEDSVRWVREEFRRVSLAGGWEGEFDVSEDRAEERWGVGSRRWSKGAGLEGCGRVPTVREWKEMFSDGRIWRVDGGGIGGK